MPNGKPGDHPLTDMIVHGLHPFPPDIEDMLREILSLSPGFPDDKRFGRKYSDQLEWNRHICDIAAGRNVEAGRVALKQVLVELRDPEIEA